MPNGAARSLITRRTQTVGALLPDLHGAFFSELIRGIDLAARQRGLHLLVSSSHGSPDETGAALRAMLGRVDGLLLMSPHADDDFLATHLPPALPTVLVNTWLGNGQHSSISVDNHGGAVTMVEHLAGQGYTRIAFIGGPAHNYEARERLRGYREAMARCCPGVEPLIYAGDFTEEAGHAAGCLAVAQRPQAVFAANDMMAIGCLAALHEAGLRVPHDMALAGFDDIPMARYLTPPLTTMRIPIAQIGEQALQDLVLAIDPPEHFATSARTTPTELVVRASSEAGRAD
nr:LacI family DNA-binding transcriptional regulator [Oleiagrimonas sp. C23AA]